MADAMAGTVLGAVGLSSTSLRGIRWKSPPDIVPRLGKGCLCATHCPIPEQVNFPKREEQEHNVRENDTREVERIRGAENETEPEGDDGESSDRRLIAWMTPPI